MSDEKKSDEKVHESGLRKPSPSQQAHHPMPNRPLDEQMEEEAVRGTPEVPLPKGEPEE